MKKVSDATLTIIKEHPYLLFGFKNGLFNLTKLARFLKPYIEIMTKKEVTEASVLMSLSRFKKKSFCEKKITHKILNISVHSNLCSATYTKDPVVLKNIHKFSVSISREQYYSSYNTSTSEITMILSESLYTKLSESVRQKPNYLTRELSSISVQFEPETETPGLLYYLIQQVSVQNINISEISSTNSELVFYVNKNEVSIVFDTFNKILIARSD